MHVIVARIIRQQIQEFRQSACTYIFPICPIARHDDIVISDCKMIAASIRHTGISPVYIQNSAIDGQVVNRYTVDRKSLVRLLFCIGAEGTAFHDEMITSADGGATACGDINQQAAFASYYQCFSAGFDSAQCIIRAEVCAAGQRIRSDKIQRQHVNLGEDQGIVMSSLYTGEIVQRQRLRARIVAGRAVAQDIVFIENRHLRFAEPEAVSTKGADNHTRGGRTAKADRAVVVQRVVLRLDHAAAVGEAEAAVKEAQGRGRR